MLSAFASRRGAVLTQLAIGQRENELTRALPLLHQIDLTDVLITGDAMFAPRSLCAHIVVHGGHYVFEVKDNQSALPLQRSFRNGPGRAGRADDRWRAWADRHSHSLHTRPGLEDDRLTWPGLGQICRLVHQSQRRGRWHTEVHYKITSLPPERASPADLLRFSRVHWAIENQLHYV